MSRVAAVAPRAPASDRPKVKGAAACAAITSTASEMSWAMTATLPAITAVAAPSNATAITSEATRASTR